VEKLKEAQADHTARSRSLNAAKATLTAMVKEEVMRVIERRLAATRNYMDTLDVIGGESASK